MAPCLAYETQIPTDKKINSESGIIVLVNWTWGRYENYANNTRQEHNTQPLWFSW